MKPVIRKPTEDEKREAATWPIWEKEVSEFPWEYDEKETCLILEGEVTVVNEDGEEFHFGEGGLRCIPKGNEMHLEDNQRCQETLQDRIENTPWVSLELRLYT